MGDLWFDLFLRGWHGSLIIASFFLNLFKILSCRENFFLVTFFFALTARMSCRNCLKFFKLHYLRPKVEKNVWIKISRENLDFRCRWWWYDWSCRSHHGGLWWRGWWSELLSGNPSCDKVLLYYVAKWMLFLIFLAWRNDTMPWLLFDV